jgi:hypothetical protein
MRLTLKAINDEFNRLKKLNRDILQGQGGPEDPEPESSKEPRPKR